MEIHKEKAAEKLYENGLITQEELVSVKAYRSLGIFSLHNELLFVLYLAVLLVSGGIGILIYQNIDTIGHTILIGLIFIAVVSCFYFSFRKAPRFSPEETFFPNPIFDYLVLFGTLLSGTFFGYLQYQYSPHGNTFALAAFFTSAVGFAAAYYFDNRSALSIAITALATTIGITVTPQAVLAFEVFDKLSVFYYGIGLAFLLCGWAEYSEKTNLKKHFAPVFYGFGLHLAGICCIAGMLQDLWPLFALIFIGCLFYFFKKSYLNHSTATFVFVLLYGFIGLNIAIMRTLIAIEEEDLFILAAYLAPFFYIGSIILFVIHVKKFNKNSI